jgi:cbb3-type cytochrome oxidase subunit 3
MKLSDIVSSMHLTIYAEIPLLVFMGIFLGVCVHMLRRRDTFDQVAHLPLRNDQAPRGPR